MNSSIAGVEIYGAIMIIYLVAMIFVGWLANKHTKTIEDFWVAGRKLGPGVLTGTFTATFISSFTMIGMAGAGYNSGWSQWMVANGTWLGPLIMVLTIQYFVRFLGYTVPDIIEARYGPQARPVAAFISGLGTFAYTGVQMYAMGNILSLVFGWNLELAMILTSVTFIVYTMAGGFLSVAWTDCVQAVMLVLGLAVTVVIALSQVNGLAGLNAAIVDIDPKFIDPWGFTSPMTVIAFAIAFGLGNPSQPAYLSRAFAAKNTASIRIALANGALMNVWGIFCGVTIGMVGRVLFGPNITPSDMVFPYVVSQLLHPIFGGLIIASIIAAIMSTADSYLIYLGTTISRDFYHRYINPNASDKQLLNVTRWSVGVGGILALIIALNAPGTILVMGSYVFGEWLLLSLFRFTWVFSGEEQTLLEPFLP